MDHRNLIKHLRALLPGIALLGAADDDSAYGDAEVFTVVVHFGAAQLEQAVSPAALIAGLLARELDRRDARPAALAVGDAYLGPHRPGPVGRAPGDGLRGPRTGDLTADSSVLAHLELGTKPGNRGTHRPPERKEALEQGLPGDLQFGRRTRWQADALAN